MSSEIKNPICEHEWIEYDDPAAYNDGLSCPSVAICNKCGAQKDIRDKYAGINRLKWYEKLLMLPFLLIVILYFFTIAPILVLIGYIKDEFAFKKA